MSSAAPEHRQTGNAFVCGHRNRIVDRVALCKSSHRYLFLVVDHQPDHLQSLRIFLLQFHQVRNLHAARPAPRSPKIQQHHFPSLRLQTHGRPIHGLDRKRRRRIRISYETNHILCFFCVLNTVIPDFIGLPPAPQTVMNITSVTAIKGLLLIRIEYLTHCHCVLLYGETFETTRTKSFCLRPAPQW
jgi:hypothetical protein